MLSTSYVVLFQQSIQTQFLKNYFQSWGDGSVVKGMVSSPKGPQFNSQKPHGSSQRCVTHSNTHKIKLNELFKIRYFAFHIEFNRTPSSNASRSGMHFQASILQQNNTQVDFSGEKEVNFMCNETMRQCQEIEGT